MINIRKLKLLSLIILLTVLLAGLLGWYVKKLGYAQRGKKINLLYDQDKQKFFPGAGDLTVEELVALDKKAENLIFVDVRSDREQQVSMIPGSVTLSDYNKHPDRYKNSTVIAYSTIGRRSGIFVQKLSAQKKPAYNLKGGLLAWIHAGRAITSEIGRTNKIVVPSGEQGLLPAGYKAVR